MKRHLLVTLACLAAGTTAHANLTITLTEAGDGGVNVTANGMSTGNVTAPFDNFVPFSFPAGIFPDNDGGFTGAGGNVDVGGIDYEVPFVRFSTFGDDDVFDFITDESVIQDGPATANDITAAFSVSTLAFSSLTPGTFLSTDVAGVSLVVVPEPTSAALTTLALLATACWWRLSRS